MHNFMNVYHVPSSVIFLGVCKNGGFFEVQVYWTEKNWIFPNIPESKYRYDIGIWEMTGLLVFLLHYTIRRQL